MSMAAESRARARGSFVLELLRLNLMSGMAYRTSFVAQILFMAMNNGIFMTFWWIFFARFENLRGWQMEDVIVLYALGASGFGLAVTLFGNAPRLSGLIHQGQMDYYLVLPPDPLMHALMSRMAISGIGDLLFGVSLYALFVPFEWTRFLLFLFFVPVAAIIYTSFCVLVHSSSFWIGSAEGVGRFLGEALTTFALYPSALFDGAAKVMLYTLIPAAFMTHLPASLLRNFDWGPFVAVLLFTSFLAIVARQAFQAGLRRYESGNLIAPRL